MTPPESDEKNGGRRKDKRKRREKETSRKWGLTREEWAIIILILAIVGAAVFSIYDWVRPREDRILIKEAVMKTGGRDAPTVEYFIYSDKGYFKIYGPLDADGIMNLYKIAKASEGKQVSIVYYGWRIDGWGWYPIISQVHTTG